MKVIIDDNIPYIRGRIEPVADVTYVDQFGFTPELVKNADALIIRTRTRCDSSLLEGSSVKAVITATIGVDQIDMPWCAQAGIKVANAPGCNAPAVAQYVWASLLRLGLRPEEAVVGVVGCGNVGSIVADWGRALGAHILVSDPPRQEAGISDDYASLDEIMAKCDAVTFHTPLILDGLHPTFHLAGDREFSMMKKHAVLVNAARGPVIDSAALLPYLESRHITGVIDTWEGEPEIDTRLLAASEIGTFHIAGYSRQGKERATYMALESMERFFGLELDKSGLSGPYTPPSRIIPEAIMGSYDPYIDSDMLKEHPGEFDILRRNYNFREEVPF